LTNESRQIAGILKALSHPVRVNIVMLLKQKGQVPVNTICEEVGTEQSLTSHHLNHLKKYKLINCVRKGKQIFYFLPNKFAIGLIDKVRINMNGQVKKSV